MILHADLDAFFASVEQRDNPKLRGKPVVVGGSVSLFSPIPLSSLPRVPRGVVSTASYEARPYGLYSGMPLSKARKLCPQAILVQGDFRKYEKASDRFFEICASYSPIIEQVSLDELYMDLSGTEKLWESPVWVAEQIKTRVEKEIGITCSAGISMQKTIAKIASGFKKPNGITEVHPGREKEFLAPLPIKELPGCGKQTQKFLEKLRIKTIGDLVNMRAEHIKILLGKHGIHLWNVANGQDSAQVIPPSDAKSISRSTTFPFDTTDNEFIESMMIYLVERVSKDLRETKTRGRCITVVVRTADFESCSAQCTVSSAINTSHEIFNHAKNLLYKLWDGNTKLRLIGIGVSHFDQLKTQFQLFENNDLTNRWSRIEKAADKIRNKHGFLSVTPASVLKLKRLSNFPLFGEKGKIQ